MTYVGNASRSANRVLIALVVVTIVIVAIWAVRGGLDEMHVNQGETAVVSE